MFRKKYYLQFNRHGLSSDSPESGSIANRLIQEGRLTDCVDELIMKVSSATMHK